VSDCTIPKKQIARKKYCPPFSRGIVPTPIKTKHHKERTMDKTIMLVAAQLTAVEFNHDKAALSGNQKKTSVKIIDTYNDYVKKLQEQAAKQQQDTTP
jgi:hypothetical protein